VYRFLVVKQKGNSQLGRPRRRWVYNIRMDLWGERLCSFFQGRPEGKRTLGRPRRRWVNNIRMDLWGEVGV
jgi:hypothetical protein